jgi:hypothetical protein
MEADERSWGHAFVANHRKSIYINNFAVVSRAAANVNKPARDNSTITKSATITPANNLLATANGFAQMTAHAEARRPS